MAFSHLMACNNKSEPLFAIIFGYIWFVLITHKRIEAILFGRCWVTHTVLFINRTQFYRSYVCCVRASIYVNVTLTIDWCENVFSIFIYFYSCTFWARRIARSGERNGAVKQKIIQTNKDTQAHTQQTNNLKICSLLTLSFAMTEYNPQMTWVLLLLFAKV